MKAMVCSGSYLRRARGSRKCKQRPIHAFTHARLLTQGSRTSQARPLTKIINLYIISGRITSIAINHCYATSKHVDMAL